MSDASREADGYEVERSSADQHTTGEQGAESDAPTREELIKGVRMAIVSWNTLGPCKVGEDASEFIADWLLVNSVTPAVPATPDAGDASEGLSEAEREALLSVQRDEDAIAVVEGIVAAAATKARAEALREAADDYERMYQQPGSATGADWLRRRADSLAPDSAFGGGDR